MGVLPLQCVQILPQDSLTTHSIYQGYFHTGKLNVGGHQVYSLQVVQDTLAGIRVPEMKKHPAFILCATSNSYSIIQISSNYAKLPQPKNKVRRAEKHPKNRLSVNHFGNHFPLFLPSFWPVNHLRATKNWMKSALVLPNSVKPYQPV